MNRQEVFNKVANHLLKQNAKSLNDDGCAYRGDKGMMCAIGCLIPDDKYTPGIENISAFSAYEPGKDEVERQILHDILHEVLGAESREDFDFLDDLQVIHDTASVGIWITELQQFADNNNLTFEVKE